MSRGNERQSIYRDDIDRESFLATLRRCLRRFDLLCHTWCLMGNHYHLVLETPRGNLARAMRHLNGVYAQRYNRRHERVGHLFQGRYTSELVQDDVYFLVVCRYVVLNPVRKGWVQDPAHYRWSSYRSTAGLEPPAEWLQLDLLLACFDDANADRAAKRFRDFVWSGIDDGPPSSLRASPKDRRPPDFLEATAGIRASVRRNPEFRRIDRYADRPPLAELLRGGTSRGDSRRRMHQAHVEWGYTFSEIAAHLDCHPSTVSRAIRELLDFKT